MPITGIIGIILLFLGARFLIKSSAGFCNYFRITKLAVGFTALAFTTSAPELSTSVVSLVHESTGMFLGNIIGSNILNLSLVLGVGILIRPIDIKNRLIRREALIGVGIHVLLFFCYLYGSVSRVVGFLFLSIFVWTLLDKLQPKYVNVSSDSKIHISRVITILALSICLLVLGGELFITSCLAFSHQIGLSETTVGLLIVSLGTALPEIVTIIMTSKSQEDEMTIGSLIGSNIFNILVIMGLVACVQPIEFSNDIFFEIILMTLLPLIIYMWILIGKNLSRAFGISLVSLYLFYMLFAGVFR